MQNKPVKSAMTDSTCITSATWTILLFIWATFISRYSVAQERTNSGCTVPECQELVRGIAGNNSYIFFIEMVLFIIVVLNVVAFVRKKKFGKTAKKRDDV
jgi:hypothetical protein